MKKILIILFISFNLGVISYSIITTMTSDKESIPLMSALALVILAIFIAFNWVTSENAQKGFTNAILTLIPSLFHWSLKSKSNYIFLILLTSIVSFLTHQFGIKSIHSYNINNGNAKYIVINEDTIPTPENNKWLSKETWKPNILINKSSSNIKCLNSNKQSWTPKGSGTIIECGEGLNPNLISNGIDSSNIKTNSTIGKRTRSRITKLRNYLRSTIPERNVDDVILIATWNIRDLGSDKDVCRNYESYHYIAEIISHFDIIAIQETKDNLSGLINIKNILGSNYDVIYSLVSQGNRGNQERMAFFYDRRKIQIGEMVSSVVIKDGLSNNSKTRQLSRTPFIVTFETSNSKITLCNTHIYFGKLKGNERVDEIKILTNFLNETRKYEKNWKGELGIIGDLGVQSINSPELKALQKAGFKIERDLANMATNSTRTKPYDQIALAELKDFKVGRYGVIDYYNSVYTLNDETLYLPEMKLSKRFNNMFINNSNKDLTKERSLHYKNYWRTFQMSDHLPKWIELRNISELNNITN